MMLGGYEPERRPSEPQRNERGAPGGRWRANVPCPRFIVDRPENAPYGPPSNIIGHLGARGV
jgi:hypothetical protein